MRAIASPLKTLELLCRLSRRSWRLTWLRCATHVQDIAWSSEVVTEQMSSTRSHPMSSQVEVELRSSMRSQPRFCPTLVPSLGGLIQRGRAGAGHSPSAKTDASQHMELAPISTAVAFDSACRHAPLLVLSPLAQLESADQ